MKRFWIEDSFIDVIARRLKPISQIVYICLKRHSNKQGMAKIGSEGIRKELGITGATTLKGLKELRQCGLISDRVGNYTSGYYIIYPLPQNLYRLPHHINNPSTSSPKVVPPNNLSIKELGINIKEENYISKLNSRTPEEQKRTDEVLAKIRKGLEEKGLIKRQKLQ